MVNQILAHISNTPKELIKYNQDKGILVEAYSPFGHGELFKNKEVQTIAEKYNVSISQLAIRYCTVGYSLLFRAWLATVAKDS